jgi:hypothetical protein
MKTAGGAVDYSAPQVRDTPEPFVWNVRTALSGRTRELERLAVELYARGLSRDIEDAFTDETGRRLLSRAAVSEITAIAVRSLEIVYQEKIKNRKRSDQKRLATGARCARHLLSCVSR